jgi:hypothetical protein
VTNRTAPAVKRMRAAVTPNGLLRQAGDMSSNDELNNATTDPSVIEDDLQRLHPSLRAGFIPLPYDASQLTAEHIRAIFEPEAIDGFLRELVRAIAKADKGDHVACNCRGGLANE